MTPGRWLKRQSLRWNLLGPLFVAGSLLSIGGLVLMALALRWQLRHELAHRGELLAHALSQAAETQTDPVSFERFVAAAGAERDVLLIVVLSGKDGTVVASTRQEWIGLKLEDLPDEVGFRGSMDALESDMHQHYFLEGERVEYVEPILYAHSDDRLAFERGAVVMQLDTRMIDEGLAHTFVVAGTFLTGTLLLFLLWMMGVLERRVLQPLANMAGVMRLRAAGDPSALVEVEREDEVGQLARSLNGMLLTVHEQTEVAQRSAARFQTIFDHSTSAIILFDKKGVFDGNRAALQLLRCDRKSQLLGLQMVDFAPACQPDGRSSEDKCREISELSMRQGYCRSECVLMRRDGTVFSVDLALTPVEVDERQGFLLTFSDITDYKQVQADLRRSKEVVERALRELSSHKYALDQHAIVAVTDDQGVITYANDRFCQISGYALDELLGSTHALLKSGIHSQQYYREMWDVISSGRVWRGELCNRAKDGRLYWVESTIVPFKAADGTIERYVAIRSDITTRKEAEAAMRRAKEAAEEADRAKSAFLATMSHEIRTPMNGVVGMTQLLARTSLTPDQREFVRTIEVCNSTLLALINDILDFSKIEAGRLELEHLTFDVRQCVEESLDLVSHSAAEKGLELALIFDPQVPATVVADATRLRQVLFNLLGNAIKFTAQGEVVLRVWSEMPEEDADQKAKARLCFSVQDTGIGIAQERRDHLFKAFSQGDVATTREYGGTGLGLAICDRLVHMMGGEISLESELGQGATFSFYIQAEVAGDSGQRASKPAPKLPQLKCVVVEPSAVQREALRSIFEPQKVQAAYFPRLAEAKDDGERVWLVASSAVKSTADRERLIKMKGQGYKILLSTPLQVGEDKTIAHAMVQKPYKAGAVVATLTRFQSDEAGAFQLSDRLGYREQRSLPAAEAPETLRVLVADDNQVNQKVLTLMLSRQGHQPTTVSNGQEVLDALQRAAFDVVLLDVRMPVMDGYEAARAIRQLEDPQLAGVPIVAVTAGAMSDDREKALEAGMDDYLPKPISEESLKRVLGRVLLQR
ncbi:MAG: multi-sensor hybrid histidine kinase [Puniceicoccaceae bacterium 5H]|nr:MAG: multi-sensor hybrid histidine kinase [Puniceicoccaceae bacterium 5H]